MRKMIVIAIIPKQAALYSLPETCRNVFSQTILKNKMKSNMRI